MRDDNPVRWGIIGPGSIAQAFATAFAIRAPASWWRSGRAIRARPGSPRTFPARASSTATQALLADPEVDAVYIATPHPGHAEWAIKAAEAGKHVLIEKPIGLTAYEADAIFHAARRRGTFCRRGLHVSAASADAEARRSRHGGRDRRGADDQVELRLRHGRVRCPSTGSSPTTWPAAASSMSAAIRCRWRG